MHLHINSLKRTTASAGSTDYSVILPYSITNFSSISLKEVLIPQTTYNIIDGVNNNLSFNDGTDESISVPSGNYSIYTLCSEIQSLMNSTSSGYTVSFDPTTFKVTISNSATFSLSFTTSKSIWKPLGFTKSDLTGHMSYTGPNAVQLNQSMSLFIQISELGIENQNTTGLQYTFKIPVTSTSGEINEINETNSYLQCIKYPSERSINQLTVRLVYEDGNVVSLNGVDWEMLLEFDSRERY